MLEADLSLEGSMTICQGMEKMIDLYHSFTMKNRQALFKLQRNKTDLLSIENSSWDRHCEDSIKNKLTQLSQHPKAEFL